MTGVPNSNVTNTDSCSSSYSGILKGYDQCTLSLGTEQGRGKSQNVVIPELLSHSLNNSFDLYSTCERSIQ